MKRLRDRRCIQFEMRSRAAILPVVAIAMPLIVALLAFALDLTRNIITVRKLRFASDAAALYIASYATDDQGNYNPGTLSSSFAAALADANGTSTAWNTAPAGAVDSPQSFQKDIFIAGSDLNLVPNPADNTELLLQVTARRSGSEALLQLFAPAITAFATLTGQPPAATTGVSVSPFRTSEVIAQPASRVGAAQPRGQTGQGSRSLLPYAAFPLALSNVGFAKAALSSSDTIYTVDLVAPSTVAAPTAANHLQASFVNLAASSISGQGYGAAQGNLAIDQLLGLFKYFKSQPDQSALLPSAVERGSVVNAFNPSDSIFQSRWSQISSALLRIKTPQWLILPVISTAPNFSGASQIVGFARVQLQVPTTIPANPAQLQLTVALGESVPLRNVSADDMVTIPLPTGGTLPPPVPPFVPRALTTSNNSVAPRLRGVAMAAAVSPRSISP